MYREKTKNWKIYKVTDAKAFSYSVDTLKNFPYAILDQTAILQMLINVRALPHEETPIWMGYRIATFEDVNSKIHKLEISYYAGFFFEHSTNKTYMVSESARRDWIDFFNKEAELIQDKICKSTN